MSFVIAIAIFFIVLVFSAINVLNEYERVVVFTLGRFTGIKGPGLVLIWPGIQRTRRVDLRVIVLNVPKQDVITRDNVSVKVNAVVYFRIVDAGRAIIQVANAFDATSQVAQTTLRSVVGQHEMDDLLAQRDKLNVDLQRILDQATENWGIKVSNAKIIHAEGEAQAAQQLVEAAKSLAMQPSALQLRYLQTLADISHERTQIIVFPLPLDLIKPFLGPHGE